TRRNAKEKRLGAIPMIARSFRHALCQFPRRPIFQEERRAAMGYWIVNGRKLTDEEHEEYERQEEREKQRAREEAQRLTQELGQAYAALKEHLRQNPGTSRRVTDDRAMDQEIYQTLRQNLERAAQAPRCAKIKADGTICGSPRMKNHLYC